MSAHHSDDLEGSRFPGRWWRRLDDGRIQCDLCPRECKLHEGQRGACIVRARAGDRMVLTTYGRSSGFCVDPVEKKPLNHFLPGSAILSFGTAGCNLACKFCLGPETLIASNRGIRPIADLFAECRETMVLADGHVGFPVDLEVWTRHGKRTAVTKVFARPYTGQLVSLRAASGPLIRATPDHGIFAAHRTDRRSVRKVPAWELTQDHYLVMPERRPDMADVTMRARPPSMTHRDATALALAVDTKEELDAHLERVPLLGVERVPYSGLVYNLEVDDPDHSYLAPFLAVANCQNWDISKSRDMDRIMDEATPEAIAAAAADAGCRSVAFTYNDPVIFAEYAMDAADACHAAGLKSVAVTAGYISPGAREEFYAKMDAANVDLKGFTDEFYAKLTGARLAPVLDTLVYLKRETNVWFEITTLLIPTKNDSDAELRELSKWVYRELGPDVPLHFTAFHPDFKMTDLPPTPGSTLTRARRIAIDEGLHYVYTGNVHDREGGTTFCPNCKAALIVRDWYRIEDYRVDDDGRCPDCATTIAGRFERFDLRRQWGRKRIPLSIGR